MMECLGMEKFIYVFGEMERDKLLEAGYQMLKEDRAQSLFIFLNKNQLEFSADDILSDMTYVRTNTLTF